MKEKETISDVFVSLQDLLKMEYLAHGFSFLAKKQKVRSVLGGRHASKLRGRGLDFEEVRNYVAGDDIRNIDWKVTARTQKTHTKVFSEEKEKPVLIVVDQSKSMFFGSQKKMKSVVAAQLAALMAFSLLKTGDRIGGVVFADNDIDIVFPKRNRKNILHFLEKIVLRNRELLESKAFQREALLKKVTIKIKNIVTHDFLVVVISDFIYYSPDVIKFISNIAQHNDVILARVFDPMEQHIPGEKFVAGNEDQQILVDGESRKIREKFDRAFTRDFIRFESVMKKHRIPVLSINTVDPVEAQLRQLLTGSR